MEELIKLEDRITRLITTLTNLGTSSKIFLERWLMSLPSMGTQEAAAKSVIVKDLIDALDDASKLLAEID